MIITLTYAQWENLVPLVRQGYRAELALGLPIDLDNGNQRIMVGADEVKLQLED